MCSSDLHFDEVNKVLNEKGVEEEYIFHFLSPNSYNEFFEYLRNKKLIKKEFRSRIEDLLEMN